MGQRRKASLILAFNVQKNLYLRSVKLSRSVIFTKLAGGEEEARETGTRSFKEARDGRTRGEGWGNGGGGKITSLAVREGTGERGAEGGNRGQKPMTGKTKGDFKGKIKRPRLPLEGEERGQEGRFSSGILDRDYMRRKSRRRQDNR